MNGIRAGQGTPPPARGSELSAEISRRVTSILDAVEEEAARIRAEANAAANAEIERARLQADELVRERRTRIAELSDELIAKTEAILGRLDDAEPIYLRFDRLIRALGEASERLAVEAGAAEAPPTPTGPDSAPTPPEPGPADPAMVDPQPPESYVAPRSSSFWRAARSGSAPTPPTTDPLTGSGRRAPTRRSPMNLDAARAAAFQLASRGASREEVENHLRVMHDIEDPAELMAETFAALESRESRRGQT